jgi:hypothetical protein
MQAYAPRGHANLLERRRKEKEEHNKKVAAFNAEAKKSPSKRGSPSTWKVFRNAEGAYKRPPPIRIPKSKTRSKSKSKSASKKEGHSRFPRYIPGVTGISEFTPYPPGGAAGAAGATRKANSPCKGRKQGCALMG